MSPALPQDHREGPSVPRVLVQFDPLHLPGEEVDVLVLGGGVAGLSAALAASESCSVLALLKGGRGETNTAWAQGGMAAVLGADDSIELHVEDTMRVAAGLGHEDVVRAIVKDGTRVVDQWVRWGGHFDRKDGGDDETLALALEGGHSRARIIHSHGDQTGAEIQRVLISQAVAHPNISVQDETFALDLVTEGNVVRGVIAWSHQRGYHVLWAGATILCTGGLGQLYRETSNPPSATGDGMAMAYRAGARLRGMEFVQFHPTVLYVAGMARFLVSEVARGEGGLLVDRNGHRFMPDYHPDAELAPRDVVSRSIVEHLGKVRDTHVYLDMRHLPREHLERRFPVINKACREFDIDMASDLIPVHPACHYMVGGVETDAWAATSLEGLYAAGEVASSGLHGGNRIASNSLLEGAVMGDRAGRHAAEAARPCRPGSDALRLPRLDHTGTLDLHDLDNALRAHMWRLVSIERDGPGLDAAARRLEAWNLLVQQRVLGDPFGWSLVNKMQVAWLITRAAADRCESRGTHYRRDFPELDDRWRKDLCYTVPGDT